MDCKHRGIITIGGMFTAKGRLTKFEDGKRIPWRLPTAARIFALLLILQLCALTAHAGTYGAPVFTGGSSYSSQYGAGSFTSSGSSYLVSADAGGSSAMATAQGPLTATFTWQPAYSGEQAPASAIITEYCSAGASGYGYYGPPSASVANDLGNSSTSSGGGNNIDVTSIGYRYSVQSGNTLSVNCNPSTSITGAMCSISTAITYTVTVDVPTIVLAGATMVHLDPSDNTSPMVPGILIGQLLAVSVITPGLDPKSWSWKPSGDPFLGFPATGGVPSMTGPAEIPSSTLTLPGFTYAYRSIGAKGSAPPTFQAITPQTIGCVVQCTDPNGNVQQVPVTATVQVYQPANSFNVFSYGTVSGHLGADGNNWLEAWNGAPPPGYAGNTTGGIWFVENIQDPAAFAANGNGFLLNTQTVVPSYTWTDANGVVTNNAMNGKFCLDGQIQYGVPELSNGVTTYEKDGPGLQVSYTGSFDDTLNMYLMYQPPNGGLHASLVALARIDWFAFGTGTVTPGVPPAAPTWVYPLFSCNVGITNQVQTSVLPTWPTANVVTSKEAQ